MKIEERRRRRRFPRGIVEEEEQKEEAGGRGERWCGLIQNERENGENGGIGVSVKKKFKESPINCLIIKKNWVFDIFRSDFRASPMRSYQAGS